MQTNTKSGFPSMLRERSLAEMHRYLKDTPKHMHSAAVGEMMSLLATRLGAEADLWAAAGFCHDIDIFDLNGDWSRHGILSAERLEGILPSEVLEAIRSHDPRTGITPASPMAEALILSDIFILHAEPKSRDADGVDGLVEKISIGTKSDTVREKMNRLGLDIREVAGMAVTAYNKALSIH